MAPSDGQHVVFLARKQNPIQWVIARAVGARPLAKSGAFPDSMAAIDAFYTGGGLAWLGKHGKA